MMNPLLTTFAVILLLVGSAGAATKWNGAGWYQVGEDLFNGNVFVHAGPFGDERSCVATFPPITENDFYDYTCEYLVSRPAWDK
jgi:hypothetical protein